MKRFASVFLIMVVILCFSACINKSQTSQNETEAKESTTSVTVNEPPLTENDIGGGELTLQKYRSIYYSIPSPFWDVIDENSRNDIYGEYWEEPYNEINTMRIKIFVEEYNVPREKFDAANAEWARIVKEKLYGTPVINPQDYANQEFDEVYNADIIYTFDDEIINEYYLSHDYPYCYESEYESAVENDFYITQTAEIINIADLKEELAFFNQLKVEKSLLESEFVTEEPVTETESASTTETVSDISETQTT